MDELDFADWEDEIQRDRTVEDCAAELVLIARIVAAETEGAA